MEGGAGEMKKVLASVVLALLGVIALANIASACWWFIYQPPLPQK